MRIIKFFFSILFFFITVYGVCDGGTRAIIINHIGEQDAMFIRIIINTQKHGFEFNRDTYIASDYYLVQEITFDEIIYFIDTNNELFREREWLEEYAEFKIYNSGTFELIINDEGLEYYYYLLDRESSALFYSQLRSLIISKEPYNDLIERLDSVYVFYQFDRDYE